MTPPRILLVDDQQQVSRVLRSSLELSGREFLISEVSSAEEALAELDRAPIDLLVTDLRLPGMSGLQLVERAKALHPHLQTVLITGNPTEEIRQRAEQLGVVAFLPKPIGTNYFLEIVQAALEVAEEKEATEVDRERAIVRERLADLRRQVGADAVYLIDEKADIVGGVGDVVDLDLEACVGPLMSAHRAALAAGRAMGARAPGNFQHIDGDNHELFLINVGDKKALLIVLRGEQEAGQLGAVMHYGRRMADVLQVLVEEEPVGPAALASAIEWEEFVADEAKKDIQPDQLEAAAEGVDASGADDFWEEAAQTPMKTDREGGLSYDEALQKGLLEEDAE
jgi:CheY-like chemotaxis protein